jgi:hypothetical protein
MLININGEMNIAVFCANQMKVINKKPLIFFILRNMTDFSLDKQEEMKINIKNELKEITI